MFETNERTIERANKRTNERVANVFVALLMLVLQYFSRLVTSLVFYGFLLYISDLAGDPYLNLVIMFVVSDVPGIILAWIAIQK